MSTNIPYYIPHKAIWPVLATAGLMLMLAGFANHLNGSAIGSTMMLVGFVGFLAMLGAWFALQATESEAGMYNHKVGISYRMGMMWFIFSEVMFFAVFFGALWYTRNLSVPWLGETGAISGPGRSTHDVLWPAFQAIWPTNGPGKLGGDFEPMGAFGLPLLNTLLLLTSGVTCTWAHHGLLANHRDKIVLASVCLGHSRSVGSLFVCLTSVREGVWFGVLAFYAFGVVVGSD